MSEKFPKKIGYFTVDVKNGKFIVDSGKTIYLEKFKKTVLNKNRILKEFNTYLGAEKFIKKLLLKNKKEKTEKSNKIVKSLYLVLLKEKTTDKVFVKVGFTSKKYIISRFSKRFGYEDYELVSIIRRVNIKDAEKYEKIIKDRIKKNKVSRFKFLNEGFSGYSECFGYESYDRILNIFDSVVKSIV
jgi:hypothetical protein